MVLQQKKPISSQRLRIPELEYLGQRAKLRRKEINLKVPETARLVGINELTLRNWERQLPQAKKAETEARLEDVLCVPRGWLRSVTISTPPIPKILPIKIPDQSIACVADEIRAIGSWLVRQAVRKRISDYNLLSADERRLVDIFSFRYGIGGEDLTTLQAIGDRYSVTRERIRQITAKMIDRAACLQVDTPYLNKLAIEVRKFLPSTIGTLDKNLRQILGASLSIVSADRFSREILGRSIVTLTDQPADMALKWDLVAVDPESHNSEQIRTIRDVAKSMIRSCGAAQILFVAGAVSGALNKGTTPEEVVRACSVISGFEWIEEEDGWFWFGAESDNRLLTATKKVLAVSTQRVSNENIHGALLRARRARYDSTRPKPYLIEPPISVVTTVLSRISWIKTVQGTFFYPISPIPIESVLSDVEMMVFNLMKGSGNVASRHFLTRILVKETGTVTIIGLHKCLDESPIFTHLDRGIFALRGAPLIPSAIESALADVGGSSGGKKLESVSPDTNGYFTIRFELSDYMVKSRFWDIPVALSDVMKLGNYQVDGFDEPATHVLLSGGSHRLNKFVTKLINTGFKTGDQILLHVNPESFHILIEKI